MIMYVNEKQGKRNNGKKSVQPIVASESKYQISWFKQRTNAVSYPTNKLRKKKSLIIAKGKKNLSLRKEHGKKKNA